MCCISATNDNKSGLKLQNDVYFGLHHKTKPTQKKINKKTKKKNNQTNKPKKQILLKTDDNRQRSIYI